MKIQKKNNKFVTFLSYVLSIFSLFFAFGLIFISRVYFSGILFAFAGLITLPLARNRINTINPKFKLNTLITTILYIVLFFTAGLNLPQTEKKEEDESKNQLAQQQEEKKVIEEQNKKVQEELNIKAENYRKAKEKEDYKIKLDSLDEEGKKVKLTAFSDYILIKNTGDKITNLNIGLNQIKSSKVDSTIFGQEFVEMEYNYSGIKKLDSGEEVEIPLNKFTNSNNMKFNSYTTNTKNAQIKFTNSQNEGVIKFGVFEE